MASHGITRSSRTTRTETQRQADLDKIANLTTLQTSIRARVDSNTHDAETFALSTKLLRLNPEYYTIWNVRRRCLTCGLLSRRSPGSSPSAPRKSSSATYIPSASSAALSTSSSSETPPDPGSRGPVGSGKSGITPDADAADENKSVDDRVEKDGASEEDQKQDLNVLKSELGFTVPLLLAAPKCYWIWEYRRWLLEQGISRLDVPAARRLWEEELGLASKMLTKDKRNFHAWGYRRQLVSKLESDVLQGTSMVESEFEYTTKMIHVDLSNFSAWHNRAQLIPRLLDERGSSDADRQAFLDKELNLVREALNVGPEDQSLWYYHQYLILSLSDSAGRLAITPNFSIEDRARYVKREIVDIKDLLEDYDDIKWVYEALMEYTLALSAVEQREPTDEEKQDLKEWLSKLRKMDSMRNGRWDDVERLNGLA